MRTIIALFMTGLLGVTQYVSGKEVADTKTLKAVELALFNLILNQDNLSSCLYEYQGTHIEDTADNLSITEFIGFVAKSDEHIRSERIAPRSPSLPIGVRMGLLRSESSVFVISGPGELGNDAYKLEKEKYDILKLYYDVDAFSVFGRIPSDIAGGLASNFRAPVNWKAFRLVSAGRSDNGVAAVFETSQQYGFYQIVTFAEESGWMPKSFRFVRDVRPLDERGKGIEAVNESVDKKLLTIATARYEWNEPLKGLYVPVIVEMQYNHLSQKKVSSVQIRFKWFDPKHIDDQLFTTKSLETSHRSGGFGRLATSSKLSVLGEPESK